MVQWSAIRLMIIMSLMLNLDTGKGEIVAAFYIPFWMTDKRSKLLCPYVSSNMTNDTNWNDLIMEQENLWVNPLNISSRKWNSVNPNSLHYTCIFLLDIVFSSPHLWMVYWYNLQMDHWCNINIKVPRSGCVPKGRYKCILGSWYV